MKVRAAQLKAALPVIILLSGAVMAWALVAIRSETGSPAPANEAPPIQVMRAIPQTLALNVRSQGVVTPRTEIDLVSEVAGRIIKLHPAFVTGNAFKAGDILVALDPRDYDHAIVQAQALVAEAKHRLAREEEEANQASYEWQVLGKEKPPTPLMLREPQLAEARAKLKAAEADVAQARLQRSRCEWRAPFAGKIREKSAGLGQFVQPGAALARLYAIDIAEVRLPLTTDQMIYVDWPVNTHMQGNQHKTITPKVTLTAQFSGALYQWQGRIARLEGAMNEASGMLHAVAEIDTTNMVKDSVPPFLPGLFVQAEIEGRALTGLFRLPREAVNANRAVVVIDAEGRLRIRPVRLLRIETDHVLVSDGLAAEDLIVINAIQTPIEGVRLRYEIVEPDSGSGQSQNDSSSNSQ